MAYMSQEKKALIAAELKKVMPKTWKYTVGVNHHSTIVLTIACAPVDLVAEWNRVCQENHHGPEHIPFNPATSHIQVNEFYLERQFDKSLPLFKKIKECLNTGNHDRSDMMTDYFDVGWYVSINIGRWNKPFVCTRHTEKDMNLISDCVKALSAPASIEERIEAALAEQNRLLAKLANS